MVVTRRSWLPLWVSNSCTPCVKAWQLASANLRPDRTFGRANGGDNGRGVPVYAGEERVGSHKQVSRARRDVGRHQ